MVASPPVSTTHPDGEQQSRSLRWKVPLSLLLIYHVAALLIAPASVPPSSDLVRSSWLLVGPYLQLMNMNQGNHFFAPDPGSSTVIKYEATLANGEKVSGQFPDKNVHFPRLMYHRHFMLTETFGGFGDYEPRNKALLATAFARQICQELEAESVDLTQVTHFLPSMQWIRAGYSLDHPELLQEQRIGHYEWAEF